MSNGDELMSFGTTMPAQELLYWCTVERDMGVGVINFKFTFELKKQKQIALGGFVVLYSCCLL